MKHRTEGLARPCSAWDLFTVAGGLQCGNCLATNIPPDPRPMCSDVCRDDVPCPLHAEDGCGGLCWIHHKQREHAQEPAP